MLDPLADRSDGRLRGFALFFHLAQGNIDFGYSLQFVLIGRVHVLDSRGDGFGAYGFLGPGSFCPVGVMLGLGVVGFGLTPPFFTVPSVIFG